MRQIDERFWREKRVAITGHTGFLGASLAFCLQSIGAKVSGYSLKPTTQPNLYSILPLKDSIEQMEGDINHLDLLQEWLNQFKPQIIFHLAGQSSDLIGVKDPLNTFTANFSGTLTLLEAIRLSNNPPRAVVMASSDKCYRHRPWPWGYRENDPLGGDDPFSASKTCAEFVIKSYRKAYATQFKNIGIATARTGNIIGGGDFAPCRLVPDVIKSFSNKETAILRHPDHIRPWIHIFDVMKGYLLLAESLSISPTEFCTSWNFGPLGDDLYTVVELVEMLGENWPSGADWEVEDAGDDLEKTFMKLDSSKARHELGWLPRFNLQATVNLATRWYWSYYQQEDMETVTRQQLQEFLGLS